MAPILIDGRGLFKLGFTALVITALIFFGGFFAGYKKASEFYQLASEIQPLPLPEVAENDIDQRNPPVPEVIVIGENIDVDQPAMVLLASNAEDTSADDSRDSQSERSVAAIANEEKTASDLSDETVARTTDSIAGTAELSSIDFEPVDITSIDIDKVKYSIQVGMYGNIINAENMVKMLQVQNLNAYISDYKNKKDEVRYNVRFGYFQDKRSAISKLKGFKASGKGDGYLVRFSARNLLNMAKTGASQIIPPALETSADVSSNVPSEVKGDTKISDEKSLDVSTVDLGTPASYR